MPLLDHFHPPLHGPRRWEGFHHAWATVIAQCLNQEILPPDWDATADLKPYQYNLVSKQRVKKAYRIDVVAVHPGSVREHDWTAFFSRVNVKWCEQFGWPNRSTKGLVKVTL